jgi:Reverse transcriptase (RNA-dependent DNA polymerase)
MLTLSEQTLNWAIEHLAKHFDPILPHAFEFEAMNYRRQEIIDFLSGQDILQWSTRPFRRCLVPKQRNGFRIVTQLDPLDMLVYLALILEVGDSIENARLSTDAKVCFSYRYLADDSTYSFFNRNMNYASFQARSDELAKEYKFVLLTDIADCYSRMNLTSIRNALTSALPHMPEHAEALIHVYEELDRNNLHGLPVGDNPSRLVAELVIDDIDRWMYARDVQFTRFVDDYRIFCHSREEAYQSLANLADYLYDTHGLTLQSQKTKILEADIFKREVLGSKVHREITDLADDLDKIIGDVEYDEDDTQLTSPDVQDQIDELGLENLLMEQLKQEEINISIVRFIVNRLAQTKRSSAIDSIILEIDKLYSVFPEVIRYFISCSDDISSDIKHEIGELLYVKIKNSVYSSLDYHRMQMATLFSSSEEWLGNDKVDSLYNLFTDIWSRPMINIAYARRDRQEWFRKRMWNMDSLPVWERRSFLYAASCLPEKEREGYYSRIGPKLDVLESIVVNWARNVAISAGEQSHPSRLHAVPRVSSTGESQTSVTKLSLEDFNHQSKLLNIKKKRLQVLEEQHALYGITTPAHIIIEVRELSEQINSINTALKNNKPKLKVPPRRPPVKIDNDEDLPF